MKKELMKSIISVCSTLENLCEGFDIKSKSALISSKLKILVFVDEAKKISPSALIDKVGIAKSNLTLLCQGLCNDNLLERQKDEFDSRVVFYSLTSKGKDYLNSNLDTLSNNFYGQLAYKNKFKEIKSLLDQLKAIIN